MALGEAAQSAEAEASRGSKRFWRARGATTTIAARTRMVQLGKEAEKRKIVRYTVASRGITAREHDCCCSHDSVPDARYSDIYLCMSLLCSTCMDGRAYGLW